MNTNSALVFPLLNYKGVIDWTGLPISVDGCSLAMSVDDFPGVESGFSSPFFIKAPV
jgi:hypothetical protein